MLHSTTTGPMSHPTSRPAPRRRTRTRAAGVPSGSLVQTLEPRLLLHGSAANNYAPDYVPGVDPNTPKPKFVIAAMSQMVESMSTWKNDRGINTLFGYQKTRAVGGEYSMPDWTLYAAENGLFVIRQPPTNPTTGAYAQPNYNAYADYNATQDYTFDPALDVPRPYAPQFDVGKGYERWLLGYEQPDEPNRSDRFIREDIKSTDTPEVQARKRAANERALQRWQTWLNGNYANWRDPWTDAGKTPPRIFETFAGDQVSVPRQEHAVFYPGVQNSADDFGSDWYPINKYNNPAQPISYYKNDGPDRSPGTLVTDPNGVNPYGYTLNGAKKYVRVQDPWNPGVVKDLSRGEVFLDYARPDISDGYQHGRRTPGTDYIDMVRDDPSTTNLREPGYGREKVSYAVIEASNQELVWKWDNGKPVKGLDGDDIYNTDRELEVAEFRGQIWDPIIQGARMIVYFVGREHGPWPANIDPTPAEISDEMKKQNDRITALADVLVSPRDPDVGISFAAGDQVAVPQMIAKPGDPTPLPVAPKTVLQGTWRRYGDSDYFIVQNMSSVSGDMSFFLHGEQGRTVEVMSRDDGRTVSTVGISAQARVVDHFGPYDTHVYRVRSVVTPPLTGADIGSPAPAGSTTAVSADGFDVVAGGNDVWNAADAFHFAHTQVTGDFDVKARVESYTAGSDPWAKAGIMARAALTHASANVFMLATPGANGYRLQVRAANNATTTAAAGTQAVSYPNTWVRLKRVGNQFTGYSSSDGTNWTPVSTQTVSLPTTVYLGLGATSHNTSAATTVKFRTWGDTTPTNVVPFNFLQEGDVGSPAVAGDTVKNNDSSYNVAGAGNDIWGGGDQFHYARQQITGNFDARVRVESFSGTDPWAKAGLMARKTLSGNSENFAMLATPGANGYRFQKRTASGATTTADAGAQTANRWVRLTRVGDTFTGYSSNDGVNWTLVGSGTLAMGSTIYLGLAVTSHNAGVLTTVNFLNLSGTIG